MAYRLTVEDIERYPHLARAIQSQNPNFILPGATTQILVTMDEWLQKTDELILAFYDARRNGVFMEVTEEELIDTLDQLTTEFILTKASEEANAK